MRPKDSRSKELNKVRIEINETAKKTIENKLAKPRTIFFKDQQKLKTL
jgi:hypothetical protein